MSTIKTEYILNFAISCQSVSEITQDILRLLEAESYGHYFVCANPHSLEVAASDSEFRQAIDAADFVVPDGVGILLASRLLGGTIRQRVTGSDVFESLSRSLNTIGGYSYFFLGASEETLETIQFRLANDYPNIRFAGSYSPPFKSLFSPEDEQLMIESVNRAAPDVLWVGMTAPKQEKWIFRHHQALRVKFVGPIGAFFDFYSGRVKRPHPFIQRCGLEWLLRLIQEPRRLWRRNFVSNPRFMLRVLRARLRGERAVSCRQGR